MMTGMETLVITIMLLVLKMEIRMTTMPLMMMIKTEVGGGLDGCGVDEGNDNCDSSGTLWLFEQCLFFFFGPDGERQTDGTDASRKRDVRSSAGHHRSEDTSDSREDEAAVSLIFSVSQDKNVSLRL